jgi:hypothetical protein
VVLALLTTLAALLGLGCVLLSWSHVRRIGEANSDDLGALTIALKKTPEAERLHELGRRARPASWEHRLAGELLEAPTAAVKIAAVNDALAELDHTFRAGAGWPSGAIRIALFGGMLLAVSAWLLAKDLSFALGIAAIGAVSAGACFEAERSARRRVTAQRRAVDDLVAAAVGRLVADEGAALPERRSRRRSAR